MHFKSLTFLSLLILLTACKDEDGQSSDYRDTYTGKYSCTKSTTSFEDEMFTTDIDLTVEMDNNQNSNITINGSSLPVSQEGKVERISVDGNVYEVEFRNDSIFVFTHPDAIGFFAYCYIKGPKD